MKAAIQEALDLTGTAQQIKVLYAVESSSRAWGFPSKNSDWDVRFLYIHHPDWYLQIDAEKDSLERMLPGDIDLSGWELKKALRLFRKSNPPLLEWLASPLIYLEEGSLATKMRTLSADYFSPRSCLHHYLNMARNNYEAYLRKDLVRLKKYFYVLRPLLACDWIRSTGKMAPVEFDMLLDSQVKDAAVRQEIDRLLERKLAGEELNEAARIALLNVFLEDKLHFYDDYVKQIDRPEEPDTGKLNELFREILTEAWT